VLCVELHEPCRSVYSVYSTAGVRQQQWQTMLRRNENNVSSKGARMVSDKLKRILIAFSFTFTISTVLYVYRTIGYARGT
jgi:hypothetical protein